MIKTVKGVTAKLTTARDMGYKYCKVSVDNNNIGCALIKDILDSISYCSTPGGKIRTFVHRGYEYSVDEGIEITILTDEEFLEHYIGLPCNKDLVEKEQDKVMRDALEKMKIQDVGKLTKEEMDHLNGMLEARDALRNTIKANPVEEDDDDEEDEDEEEEQIEDEERNNDKPKDGFFSRFKRWLKGDVGYKR